MRTLLAIGMLALSVGAASANNTFGVLLDAEEGAGFYDIRLVRTLAPGVVELRDSRGRVLGREEVRTGTTTSLRVDLGIRRMPRNGVFAVLVVDGVVVDRDRVRVVR
ncbi:MAG: hypothetical protein AAF714_07170 [Pseudomonadota bacterium]